MNLKGDPRGKKTNTIELGKIRAREELRPQLEAWTAIKSQYLADFIAEYTDTASTPTEWSLYVDDSSNKIGSGAGVILENDQGTQIKLSLKFEFSASNNQAEYEALLASLKVAREVGAQKLTIFSNSQVVTSQIEGSY
ncbi:uncharacterized protein [Arachis hypogaea]|uniref:uncharacterized protein n=1 Tax=Arachis hypogaea TaxID=3818 RepID=UPI003B221162